MIAPRYRTDAMACSCKGFWFRRSCRHWTAYCEAVSLVLAQDAVNLAWDTASGGSGAVRGSQNGCPRGNRSQEHKASPIPAKLATIGEPYQGGCWGPLPGAILSQPGSGVVAFDVKEVFL